MEDFCRMDPEDIRLRIGQDPQGIHFTSLQAEETVWNFLDLHVLEGNPKQQIAGMDNLVITESVRKRFFPHQNPVGMRLQSINTYNEGDTFLITGVIRDLPQNSHLRADVIVIRKFSEGNNSLNDIGAGNFLNSYVLLHPGTNLNRFTAKANSWFKNKMKGNARSDFFFQPMTDIYLRSDFDGRQMVKGDISRVYILSGVAALLLFIACINFINLATAAALRRAKATGIRKILGAGKKVLLQQYLMESLIYFLIGFIGAMLLYLLALPAMETFTGGPLPLGINRQWSVFAGTSVAVLIVTLLTGLYPAWVLSRPKAVLSFNLSGSRGRQGDFFRRALVIVQFTISIVLLICTMVVHRQVRMLDNAPLGYERNNLLVMDWMNWGATANAFRNEVAEINGVQLVSITRWIPAGGAGSMTSTIKDPEHPEKESTLVSIIGDLGFPQTLGLKLIKGRWLSSGFGWDAPNFDSLMRNGRFNDMEESQSELVTASTARRLGIKELGIKIKGIPGIPVGIVADFHNESLKSPAGLCMIQAESSATYGGMLIRIVPGTESHVMPALTKLFRKFYPSLALNFTRASDLLAAQYESERKLMQEFYFFSSLIVFLSCMGLFGLVTFLVQSQVKEIGIRKVLGASVGRITAMFTWNFLRLVLISGLAAVPLGWYLMNRWLQEYPYRTELRWWVFGLPFLAAAMVAILTVGVQSVRAAVANPVNALRSE
jgi:putative ABC transport system permease protein